MSCDMIIETKFLLIRPPIIEDFDNYWVMNNDPEVKKYTGGVIKQSYGEALSIHTKVCNEFDAKNKNNCIFSVVEKSSGQLIGYCGFKYCERMGDIEILYGFLRDSWGKGYGYEAAKAVLEYGIKILKLKKIVAAVNPQNIASEKILIKIGMTPNGKIMWGEQGLVNKYVFETD